MADVDNWWIKHLEDVFHGRCAKDNSRFQPFEEGEREDREGSEGHTINHREVVVLK